MSDGPTVTGRRRPELPPRKHPTVRGRRGPARMEIKVGDLHRYLWDRTDERGRVEVDVDAIAAQYGVSYPVAHRALKLIRGQGRVKLVAWKRERRTVYQVADPSSFRMNDPATHAKENTEPVWG